MKPNNTPHLKIKKLGENDFEDEEEEDEESENETQSKKKKTSQSFGQRSGVKAATSGSSGGAVVAPPRCLVVSCQNDLSGCKKYHQRHRVCEFHSKAPVVFVDGLSQRFCQQCSRFHELTEFDHTKRSCRRRLAGHNERRRKSSLESRSKEGLAGHNERRRKSSLESRSKEGSTRRVKEIYH